MVNNETFGLASFACRKALFHGLERYRHALFIGLQGSITGSLTSPFFAMVQGISVPASRGRPPAC